MKMNDDDAQAVTSHRLQMFFSSILGREGLASGEPGGRERLSNLKQHEGA
jgi:hypothetical protein